VKLLLEAGADVGARAGQLGETPLHGAAGRGHAHVVRFLLYKRVLVVLTSGGFL
jgi:ankyrin repeat protein